MKHDATGRHFSVEPEDLVGAARAAIELGAEISPQGVWSWSQSIGLGWNRAYSDTVAALAGYLHVWDGAADMGICIHSHHSA